ncbi:MAG: hypothetical protein HRU22_08865 [Gammaproteobacteria bacterium]|nr:hypothetical protein [Gammaproteobacteria bacterium]
MVDLVSTVFSYVSIRDVGLFILTVFTSTIAGIFGLGGGLILAVSLSWLVPVNAVVPIHGTTQLASNASRLFFCYHQVV